MKFTYKIFLFILFFYFFVSGFSQQKKLSENATISILTCDSGQELYSIYGHTAIKINDPINGIDIVGNFGTFDFTTPNFYLKFIKGDLQYFGSYSTYDDFIAEYVYLKRGVYEQKLNLTPQQKQNIFDELITKLTTDDKFYTYKFIDKNCTTLIADLLSKNINGKLSLQVKGRDKNNRAILYGYAKNHFYENLGINILFGYKTDKKMYKVYLPLQFLESIKNSQNNNVPLCATTQTVLTQNTGNEAFSWWNNCYTYLLFFVFLIIINNKKIYLTYLFILGILGIFLATLGFFSLHQETHLNYNVLLFNPLYLPLVFFIIKNKTQLAVKVIYAILIITIIYFLMMLNKVHFWMFLPFMITNFIINFRLIKNKKNKLLTTVK